MFYVMCSTYCVCMFLCLLYAPIHQNKFQVGVNLLGNKYYSDSDSDSDFGVVMSVHVLPVFVIPVHVLWLTSCVCFPSIVSTCLLVS